MIDLSKEYTVEDSTELQVAFLETLCRRWEVALARHVLMKEGKGNVDDINAMDRGILKEAEGIMRKILLARDDFYFNLKQPQNSNLREVVKKKCANDWRFFVDLFCWIHEPRMPKPLISELPFITYPAQAKIGDTIEKWYENQSTGIIFKSRGAGISWLFCALVIRRWLFDTGFTCIMGSEKEEKVDVKGLTRPLFGMMRYILYHLPKWLRPDVFANPDGSCDLERRLINPDTGSEIIGEIGANIGRSGRASLVIIDESQEIEKPEKLDFSLESVTGCRIDVGTASGLNHFGRKIMDRKLPIAEIHWKDDPRINPLWKEGKKNLDCAWRKLKELTVDKVVMAQEYDMDLNASVEDAFIPAEYVSAAVDFDLIPEGDRVGGFDVAGGGENHSVYITRIGPVCLPPHDIAMSTSFECTQEAIDLAETDDVQIFNYDINGLGEGVYGQLKAMDKPIRFPMNGVSGNGAASEGLIDDEGIRCSEKFRNRRAENWWNAFKRFEKTYMHRNGIRFFQSDEMVSIPNDQQLIMQLSQPKKRWYGSKLGVESKEEMRNRGVKSPDFADAFILAFANYDGSERVIDRFNYTLQKKHYLDFDTNILNSHADSYVVICQTPDMTLHAICCTWSGRGRNAILKVYAEFVEPTALPCELVEKINDAIQSDMREVKEWIANEEMFVGDNKGVAAPYYMFRKAGVHLHRNYQNDWRGGIMLANQMFDADMIQIHKQCDKTMAQLSIWGRRRGEPDQKFGLAMCLCLLVTRLRKKREISDEEVRRKIYGKIERQSVDAQLAGAEK